MAAAAATASVSYPTPLSSPAPALSGPKPVFLRPSNNNLFSSISLHCHLRIKPFLPFTSRRLLTASPATVAEAEITADDAAAAAAAAVASPPAAKPKTGKAALPLKRDRVRNQSLESISLSILCYLASSNKNHFFFKDTSW